MFSDSRAPAPGDPKGFKPHGPHFIPWLRNSLKSHHGSDLGLNRPHKSNPEARGSLTPLERAKGIGFFSFPGKDRAKKADLRFNGIGMTKMLPVVLRGPHILGSQWQESPVRRNQSPESEPKAVPGEEPRGPVNSLASTQENLNLVRKHSSGQLLQKDRGGSAVRKYGPLVGPPPVPVPVPVKPKPEGPVVLCMEDRREKVWDYSSHTTFHHRDVHSSSWVGPDTQGLIEMKRGFNSSFSYIQQQSRNSQSQRDLAALREPPLAEGFNGPLNGVVVLSAEGPHRGCSTALRRPKKPRPSSEHSATLCHNRVSGRRRPKSEGEAEGREADCSRRAVRNQIKRVVDNLEQVLTALRDVHQEMREVVQQIDYLTSSIDLNEEEDEQQQQQQQQQRPRGGDRAKPPNNHCSGSGFGSGEVTTGNTHPKPQEPEQQPGPTDPSGPLRRDHHHRGQSPPCLQLCPVSSSERSQTLHFARDLGFPPRKGRAPQNSNNPPSPGRHRNPTSHDTSHRHLPVRPPTPGLSPLTVNLHQPRSPVSRPPSPVPSSSLRLSPVSPPSPRSPSPPPPLALSPSVIIETKVSSYPTPQSDPPSAGSLSPSSTHPPSASRPPSDSQALPNAEREKRASSASSKACATPASVARPPSAQGRRGRKPPPYPHHRLTQEHAKKAKDTRIAPPYPEKRKLLSTTV